MPTEFIDEWSGGGGWIAYPEELNQRASHVLRTEAGAWVVDPVDFDGLDDYLAEYGDLAGVVVLLNRHKRDAATIATRHDVPVYLPRSLAPIRDAFDAPVDLFDEQLPETAYRTIPLVDNRFWREVALYNDADGTLLVPEALATVDGFRAAGERIGVNLGLRLFPPRSTLGDLAPDRILVGHGPGVSTDASAALDDALAGARTRFPHAVVSLVRALL